MLGIMVIHGFGGGRYEIMPLADRLKAEGWIVETPVVVGHEKDSCEMAKFNNEEWTDGIENDFNQLIKKCDKVVAVGFSMGGLLAVNLCVRRRLAALVTVNMPIYYFDPKRMLANIREGGREEIKSYIEKCKGKPFHSLVEFQKLLNATKPMVKNIDCPIMVIQSQDDETARKSSGDYIFDNAKSETKRILKPPKGGHAIFTTEHYHNCAEEIIKFIRTIDKK